MNSSKAVILKGFVCLIVIVVTFFVLKPGLAYAMDEGISVVEEEVGEQLLDTEADDVVAQGRWGSCSWTLENSILVVRYGIGDSQAGKTESPWKEYSSSIKEICFKPTGVYKATLEGTAQYLFSGLSNVTTIDCTGLSFYSVTSMESMFADCTQLIRIQNLNVDTFMVRNVSNMLNNCRQLREFDFYRIDLSNVTNMAGMMTMCRSIETLDFGGSYMPKVQNMESAFEYCTSLKSVDLSSFSGSPVNNIKNLFRGCSSLETVGMGGINTHNASSLEGIFKGCEMLRNIDVRSLDTSSVTSMDDMFQGCAALTSLDLTGLDTSCLTSVYGLCGNCSGLTSFDASGWDTSHVNNMGGMFTNCSRITSIKLDGWDMSSVDNMQSLFSGCSSLTMVDMSGWDTNSVSKDVNMFTNCSSISEFVTGESYHIASQNMIPNAVASNGMWWSKKDSTWYTKEQIASKRSFMADTYMAESEEEYKTSITTANITLSQREYAWTGEGIEPFPKVVLGKDTLRNGVDYTLTYANNINVGNNTASLIVTGKGNYKGSKAIKFSITYSASFNDVTERTAHVQDIIWLANAQISTGFPNGTFRPGASVTRADMAAFLFRLACRWGIVDNSWKANWVVTEYTDDVTDSTPHAREIRWLVSTGISTGWKFQRGGYTFTRFRPYSYVARQDMAAFLFRLAKLAGKGGASNTWVASTSARQMFRDVDPWSSSNHHNEVWWLAQTGVSEGWVVSGGMREFRGLKYVARQDMAAFLHRLDSLE